MKIWLDDIRDPPDNSWEHFKTGEDLTNEIVEQINSQDEAIEEISFDHDLGENCLTGYGVACFIESIINAGMWKRPIKWTVHSANPVGRKNIEAAMKNCDKFWYR